MSYVQNTPEFDPIDMNSLTQQNVHNQSLLGNMIPMLGVVCRFLGVQFKDMMLDLTQSWLVSWILEIKQIK